MGRQFDSDGTVRQETTMARHGTLPDYMTERQCEITENPDLEFDESTVMKRWRRVEILLF